MEHEARHLLSTEDLSQDELRDLLELADRLPRKGPQSLLKGKTLGLLFEDPSLRTRVSFEVAMIQLGGSCIPLSSRGDLYELEATPASIMDGPEAEHVKDAARTLSRYVDAIGIRAAARGRSWAEDRQDALLQAYAAHASVPVINLQSQLHHPCQALADIATMRSKAHDLRGRKLAICWTQNPEAPSLGAPHSLLLLASRLGMDVTLAHPQGFELDDEVLEKAREHSTREGASLRVVHDMDDGVEGCEFLYARSWRALSCYDDPDRELLLKRSLDRWRVRAEHVDRDPAPWFLHPLPVRRNLSVEDSVLDGERSLVYDQAENRVHTQKALLVHLL